MAGVGVNSNAGSVTVLGNYIGTNAAGTAALSGQPIGVSVSATTQGVTIGGTVAGAGNVIAGNLNMGVFLQNTHLNVLVAGNFIGTDVTGNVAIPSQTLGGVVVSNSEDVTIGGAVAAARNVISGNQGQGILIQPASSFIDVQGNYIGLGANGSTALPNTGNGIQATGLSKSTIGGTASGAGNVISGNSGSGINLIQTGAGVQILGNLIGTDSTGLLARGNKVGITLAAGTATVTIGSTSAGAANVISGNTADGVNVLGGTATLGGNFIGLALNGTAKLGNGGFGVLLASSGNTIGSLNVISGNASSGVQITGGTNLVNNNLIGMNSAGSAAVANAIGVQILSSGNTVQSNVISGNTAEGVLISSGSNNKVFANLIGLNAAGTLAVGNSIGVHVAGGSSNVIGATSNGNIISGNTGPGVLVEKTTGTSLLGNYIGTSKNGLNSVSNGTAGVVVSTGAVNTTIGVGNVISGNSAVNGVQVQGNASGTLIKGNSIGLNGLGTAALANAVGVVVQDAAGLTTIGGTSAAAGNTISGNSGDGVLLLGRAAGTVIQGNTIGLNANGMAAGNAGDGVNVQGATTTSIGGTAAGAGNVISGNASFGVEVGGDVGNTYIESNLIGIDPTGTLSRGNAGGGVVINDNTSGTAVYENTISGNGGDGIQVNDASDVGIGGNVIGLNKLGNAPLANTGDGADLTSTSAVIIGKLFGNVISGNTGDGVHVGGGSTGTLIIGNTIGLLSGAGQAAANAGNGINVTDTASGTTIGGTTASSVNIISGNTLNGVNIDANTSNTLINSNNIGLNGAQTSALGNGGDGIHVLGQGVRIIGNLKGANNVIAGNAGNGIQVSGSNASNTVIQGFRIGTNGAGTAALPNALDGILVTTGANGAVIGGPAPGDNLAGNLISGNGMNGIHVVNSNNTMIQSNLIGTDLSGQKALANTQDGVFLATTTGVTIGGNVDNRNTIAGNGLDGIGLSNSISTAIIFNLIGTSLGGGALGNGNDGINVAGTSSATTINSNFIDANAANGVEFGVNASGLILTYNDIGRPDRSIQGNETGVLLDGQNVTIGGTGGTLQSNTILGNTTIGIDVEATSRNVSILGNFIGIASNNFSTISNGTDGILVNGGVLNVTIGGSAGRGQCHFRQPGQRHPSHERHQHRPDRRQLHRHEYTRPRRDWQRPGRHPAQRVQQRADPGQCHLRQREQRGRTDQRLQRQCGDRQQDWRGGRWRDKGRQPWLWGVRASGRRRCLQRQHHRRHSGRRRQHHRLQQGRRRHRRQPDRQQHAGRHPGQLHLPVLGPDRPGRYRQPDVHPQRHRGAQPPGGRADADCRRGGRLGPDDHWIAEWYSGQYDLPHRVLRRGAWLRGFQTVPWLHHRDDQRFWQRGRRLHHLAEGRGGAEGCRGLGHGHRRQRQHDGLRPGHQCQLKPTAKKLTQLR